MNESLGRPVADLDDFLEPAPGALLRAAPKVSPDPRPRRPPAMWWIIVATTTLVIGVVGYWIVLQPPAAPVLSGGGGTVSDVPAMPTGVPGFAEMYLASYLTGTSGTIAEFMPGAPSVAMMTPAARYVTRAATMEVTRVADDYWSVVVAADVLSLDNGAYLPAGLQYFQVGVVDDGGRLVAVALPARVAGPAPRLAPPRALQVADGTPTDGQAALVGDFLEALLTGRREINPYLAPDSSIAAISPAPYEAIAVTSIALYEDGTALTTVDARKADGTVDSMQYVIGFSDGGPRRSVAALLAGPPPIVGTEASRP